MVSAKDLRDLFEDIRSEAGKRASDFVSDAKMPDMSKIEIGRRDETPGIVWLGVGLVLGAVVGMAIALIAAPYPGQETRRRLGLHVDKMKRQGEDQLEQIKTGKSTNAGNGGPSAYTTPTTAYERS
ncbi:MAG: YtxH domain-containing protein [Chloroflexota bacterium]|nr:YtxH domain-containing protein [Chloroflexota bacterium]